MRYAVARAFKKVAALMRLLAMTPKPTQRCMPSSRYAAAEHIHVLRRDSDKSPIDGALAPLGMERTIATIVGGYSAALGVALASDLVASVPERHTGDLRDQMHSFALPLPIPGFTVSLLWHPRMDGDPAHRWLRGCVRDACNEQLQDLPTRGGSANV